MGNLSRKCENCKYYRSRKEYMKNDNETVLRGICKNLSSEKDLVKYNEYCNHFEHKKK